MWARLKNALAILAVSNLVKVELSKKLVSFKPNNYKDFSRTVNFPAGGDFTVTVINTSQKFASFQLELHSEGVEANGGARWYRIEPHVCAKKPPGDRTTFEITLLKAPVPSYDVTIRLKIKILSVELAELAAEETILLQILRPTRTLHIYLPFEELTVYPGDRVQIPALVYNLNPSARLVTLRLKEINPAWFPEGIEQTTYLDSGESTEVAFWCAPPATSQSRHQTYPLLLEVADSQGNSDSAHGNLEILPFGQLVLDCFQRRQWIPSREIWLTQKRLNRASFDLIVHNQSNLVAHVQLGLQADGQFPGTLPQPEGISLDPDDSETVAVDVQVNRPRFGIVRTHILEITPTITRPKSGEIINQIAVQPASQLLELKVRPLIPFLLQVGGGLLALFLLGLAWWLNPAPRHRAPVNALTLMANGNTVISGSSDQTLLQWQRNPESWLPEIRRLKYVGELSPEETLLTKAVRTLQHLPENVEQVALGLEDGEIQIWQIDPAVSLRDFFEVGKPDRVFDLSFTGDSTSLFSGHGSGMIRRWNLRGAGKEPVQQLYPASVGRDFAVAALTVIEPPGQDGWLVGGGQFNRLVFWNWEKKHAFMLSNLWIADQPGEAHPPFTPVVSRQSYLTSLTAADQSGMLASADNQGLISIWRLEALSACLVQREILLPLPEQGEIANTLPQQQEQFGNRYWALDIASDCPEAIADQWQAGQNGRAVRSIALSKNGCYLTSTGDDGRVMLWPLTIDQQRDPDHRQGMVLKAYGNQSLNAIDIHQTLNPQTNQDVVLVASDTPENRVRLYRKQVTNNGCQ